MSFERVHQSRSRSPQSSSSTSQFAPRPFPVQEPKRLPTQEDIENEAFQQNKFEAFGLQPKEKHGTITPVEQQRLSVLQAKMDSFWTQRMERAKAQPNLLEILIHNSQTTQTTESKAPVQSNTIQAKSDTTSDRPDASMEQRPNKTGMPDALKGGVENLSGYSMDDVRVHYNSDRPTKLQAHAYAQGTDIHVAPGQEKHLPHETWHVVQQKQGRVKPTIQMKGGIQISDNPDLEAEATYMGEQALQRASNTEGKSDNKSITADSPSVQLKYISNYTSSIIQCEMNDEELNKLQAVLQKYFGTIDDDILNEIWNYFGSNYDTLEEALPSLNVMLVFASQAETSRFRVNATTYPRVFIAGDDSPTREELKKKMGVPPKTAKGFDLSYRQHADAIDEELDQFLPQGNFDLHEQRNLYYEAAHQSQVTTEPRKKSGMFTMTAPRGLSLSTITPGMMEHYHAMHYTPELKKPDETQSTRTYEAQYTDRAYRSMNIETFRAFFLPPSSDALANQELMINTLGASLDSNTPTRGNTIGSGKVNSTIYLHFRKTLELLNADLDKGPLKGNIESFENRTQQHIQWLRNYALKGMMVNEEAHSKTEEGTIPWDTLQPIIHQTGLMVTGMLNTLALNQKLPEFQINFRDNHVLERLRVLATILGVMIKTEKRLLVNHVILNQGDRDTAKNILTMIGNLGEIEQNINSTLAKYEPQLKALRKTNPRDDSVVKSSSVAKSESELSGEEIEQADRDFDQLVLTNNCLPEAILGRPLNLIEARRLRLNLVGNGQRIGDFLDADQPVITTIAQQFDLNTNIIIYEGYQVWRRFLVNNGNVLDVTLSNIPIPPGTEIVLERINRNHFIRKK